MVFQLLDKKPSHCGHGPLRNPRELNTRARLLVTFALTDHTAHDTAGPDIPLGAREVKKELQLVTQARGLVQREHPNLAEIPRKRVTYAASALVADLDRNVDRCCDCHAWCAASLFSCGSFGHALLTLQYSYQVGPCGLVDNSRRGAQVGRLLVVDRDGTRRSLFLRHFANRHDIFQAGCAKDAIKILEQSQVDILISHLDLPDRSGWKLIDQVRRKDRCVAIIVVSGKRHAEAARRALELQTAGLFDEKWTQRRELARLRKVIDSAINDASMRREAEASRARIARCASSRETLLGGSSALTEVRGKIELIQGAHLPVLIEGETGSGKEVAAKSIHEGSRFAAGPFVAVSMARLSGDMAESRLFGHARGAFTDAKNDRIGVFEQANGGSLFLDEIGELRHDLQGQLLRVLETNEVIRLGSNRAIPVSLRVIAATNRSLREMVQAGIFRDDLYFRLAGFHLLIPPLRERLEDIPELARHFLAKCLRNSHQAVPVSFDEEALATLKRYHWPGNVRELKTVVERLVFSCSSETVLEHHVRSQLETTMNTRGLSEASFPIPLERELNELATWHVQRALDQSGGNITRAAKLCQMKRSTFADLATRLKILQPKPRRKRSADADNDTISDPSAPPK